MSQVEFFVPGLPVAQPRPRSHRIKPKRGKAFTVTYSGSKQSKGWKKIVHEYAQEAMVGQPLFNGPLMLHTVFTFPYLTNVPKRIREPGIVLPKGSKPDWDNLGKLVSDALIGVVVADDGRFSDVRIVKYYGPNPGAHIFCCNVHDGNGSTYGAKTVQNQRKTNAESALQRDEGGR